MKRPRFILIGFVMFRLAPAGMQQLLKEKQSVQNTSDIPIYGNSLNFTVCF